MIRCRESDISEEDIRNLLKEGIDTFEDLVSLNEKDMENMNITKRKCRKIAEMLSLPVQLPSPKLGREMEYDTVRRSSSEESLSTTLSERSNSDSQSSDNRSQDSNNGLGDVVQKKKLPFKVRSSGYNDALDHPREMALKQRSSRRSEKICLEQQTGDPQ